MSEGFLQRWSRRKIQGEDAPPEEPRPPQAAPAVASPVQAEPAGADAPADAKMQQAEPPAPTLEDTRTLTPQSDFKPFMGRNVTPEVRNAAMKKLFADPHFNVMDRMDVYIDDYSNPAPLPAAMLRKMASAAFLKLVDEDEEEKGKKQGVQETPATTSVQDVAQSEHFPEEDPSPLAAAPDQGARPASQETDDDHADLRLQQDDAARAEDPRRGTA